MSQTILSKEYCAIFPITRRIVAMNPAIVKLPRESAHQKYILEHMGRGHTLAPIIPKIKRSVPIIDTMMIPIENIGNKVTIILDII